MNVLYLKHSAILKNTISFWELLGHSICYTGCDYRSTNLRYISNATEEIVEHKGYSCFYNQDFLASKSRIPK